MSCQVTLTIPSKVPIQYKIVYGKLSYQKGVFEGIRFSVTAAFNKYEFDILILNIEEIRSLKF